MNRDEQPTHESEATACDAHSHGTPCCGRRDFMVRASMTAGGLLLGLARAAGVRFGVMCVTFIPNYVSTR